MPRYFYIYTRPQRDSFHYPDPDHGMFEGVGTIITETPFGNDKTYVCYCESDEAKINWVLNSQSEFNRQKFNNLQAAVDWCNANIPHEEWEEFTAWDNEIQDNRVLNTI